MKQRTKQILGIAGLSLLVIGTTSAVFARNGYGYGPGCGGRHGMMGGPGGMNGMGGGPGWMMSGNPTANVQQRLTDLKNTLGISTDQESAWNNYAQAVQGKAELMQTHRQSMLNSGPPTPEQRLAFHQEGLTQMQQVSKARQDLLRVLSPEQQARAGNLIGLNCWR